MVILKGYVRDGQASTEYDEAMISGADIPMTQNKKCQYHILEINAIFGKVVYRSENIA
jgi:hypothetical protein